MIPPDLNQMKHTTTKECTLAIKPQVFCFMFNCIEQEIITTHKKLKMINKDLCELRVRLAP